MTNKTVLADTGPLVAILNERDHDHESCLERLKELRFPLLTCLPVLTEVSHLVRPYDHAFRNLLQSTPHPLIRILPFELSDVHAALDIVERYRDQDFDFADACVMHLTERENTKDVFTLDYKDFSVFRTSRGGRLNIIG